MQLGFFFDQTRCTGCDTCTIACKDWHEYPLGAEPAAWRWVEAIESGKYPRPSVKYLALSCLHCAHPACVDACPAGAIRKRDEDGIVVVDREACLGKDQCGAMCRDACPYTGFLDSGRSRTPGCRSVICVSSDGRRKNSPCA